MEKAVFKATRKDAVHPKQKHVDTLIQMTLSGASMEELFMLIQDRFSEANWVVSFKALIVVHILMHEGHGQAIYDFLIHHPNVLDMTRFRDRNGTKGVSEFEQSKNVRTYAAYLNDKVLAFKAIRIDHVTQKNPNGSQIYMKHPTDIKFMLLEVSTVQKQLHSVLKNRFDSDTLNNETTFSAFRYCLRDMLKLFQVMNLGVMKMLKVYFEMREEDMRRALDLYKRFVKLTDRTDEYLKIARRFEAIFGFSIPELNHAPLSLSKALEDFLNMPSEERLSTINEMKRTAKKNTPPQSSTNSLATNGRGHSGNNTTGRSKPDYGLRLKPEILAMSGEAPPAGKGTTRSTSTNTRTADTKTGGHGSTTASVAKPTATTTASVSGSNAAGTGSKAEAKKPATAEIDFIDFFSSIDDETTVVTLDSAAQSNNHNPDMAAFGNTQTGVISGGVTGVQQQNSMSDFDAMFQALSNPFAASNVGGFAVTPAAASASPAPGIQYQQQYQQQQQQSFDVFSGTSINMPFASPNPGVAGNNSSPFAANIPSSMPFTSASALAASSPLQVQQQPNNSSAGGFVNVSANNPFRQSMYPSQSDAASQQALVARQMAQMSLQQQQQQQPQISYNPFTQRQTMYEASLADGAGNMQQQLAGMTSSPFGNINNANATTTSLAQYSTQRSSASMAPLGAVGNNSTSLLAGGIPQQQQIQTQGMQPAAMNNGNFANFDFFK
ncbi:hypothetical protein GGI25_001083 [Coemansia spiralis]|uniref:ENTH domain-containing protein n=1 Tax=Coemansia spiralis TaxID=417178 RepID=A0A9W8GB29_9FUNG|nr:hypothetical protein GGI25_001083 [Coemansia spiralis]